MEEIIPEREVSSEVVLNDSVGVSLDDDVVGVATGFVQYFDDELQRDLLNIPDKMLFKIGEVATLAGIKAYILRYWESEFSSLKPKKASNNQRMYNRKDLEIVFLIKKLLYRDRYSIQGAKKVLNSMKSELKLFNKWTKLKQTQTDASRKLQRLLEDIKLAKRRHTGLQV